MISGVFPHPTPSTSSSPAHSRQSSAIHSLSTPDDAPETSSVLTPPALTSFLIIAYTPQDTFSNERTDDRAQQARKIAERPELRIISRRGEELASDALSITDFHRWGCNDYVLAAVDPESGRVGTPDEGRSYVVMSPRDLVLVKARDKRDHVAWLVARRRYEEALSEIELIEAEEAGETGPGAGIDGLSASDIGQRYIEHLVNEGQLLVGRGIPNVDEFCTRRLRQGCETVSQGLRKGFQPMGGLDFCVRGEATTSGHFINVLVSPAFRLTCRFC